MADRRSSTSSTHASRVSERNAILNTLLECAPRRSLRRCRCCPSISTPSSENSFQSTMPRRRTLNHCRVIAFLSLRPEYPTSRNGTLPCLARRSATQCVFAPLFSIQRRSCSPSPLNSISHFSVTTKSERTERIRPSNRHEPLANDQCLIALKMTHHFVSIWTSRNTIRFTRVCFEKINCHRITLDSLLLGS